MPQGKENWILREISQERFYRRDSDNKIYSINKILTVKIIIGFSMLFLMVNLNKKQIN